MGKHGGKAEIELAPGSIQQTDPENQKAREIAFPIDTSQERAEADAEIYFPEES